MTDLFQQAKADLLLAKVRAEETAAAIWRAQADDAEAQAEVARMQNVVDWFEQRRPQEPDEPQEPGEDERTKATAPAPAPASRKSAPRKRAQTMNMSDLVEEAVEQLGGSAKNVEILKHLRREGHDYTPLQVRGSAKHLGKKGRLVSGGYGLWHLPSSVPPTRYSQPAATDSPAMNGAGRLS